MDRSGSSPSCRRGRTGEDRLSDVPPSSPTAEPRVFGLAVDPDELLPADRYRFGAPRAPAGRLVDLAHAIASSPAWGDLGDALLVVRTEPPSGIAFIGSFSPAQTALLEGLPGQLRFQLSTLRYVSYGGAEEDAARLAEALADRFGRDELRSFRWLGVPRGGLFVLGMLAYALDLPRERLPGGADDGARGGSPGEVPGGGAPLVVVDDVSVSGLRFGEVLASRPEPEVIFAHLYSHPELRAAILEREERVSAAVAAHDLADHAPRLQGEDYAGWRSRWTERTGRGRYWLGCPEHLCFPWSEPDVAGWNPVTGEHAAAWRVVPPRAVLKNRVAVTSRPGGEGVQVQPPSRGPLRVAAGTYHGVHDGGVVAASLASGEVVRLEGASAEIWKAVAGEGGLDDAVDALVARYDVDRTTARRDAEELVDALIARGVLDAEGGARTDGVQGPAGRGAKP